MSGSGWSTGLLSRAGGGRGRSDFFWKCGGGGEAASRDRESCRTDGRMDIFRATIRTKSWLVD